MIPSIFIFTALECEAKPICQHFGLTKTVDRHPFSIYQGKHTVLVVAGVGKVAMASAVAYTLAIHQGAQQPILLNIGIAGQQTAPVGSFFLIDKITDAETGKTFYPQILGEVSTGTCELKSFSTPCRDYPIQGVVDMEASSFYETALRFSSSEFIHCCKVVSDNLSAPMESINSKGVFTLIEKHTKQIDLVLKELINIQQSVVQIELSEFDEIVAQWHFTVTGKLKLKSLLNQWSVLTGRTWLDSSKETLKSSKDVLLYLERDISQLEFKL